MPEAVDFGAARKQAEDSGLLGGDGFYKFKDGDNRFRLMSKCLPHTSMFDGKKNFKWLCYILDRKDGKVKAHFMPHKIYKAIEGFQTDPDYTFSEVPMPFDINVKAVKAGTMDVEYTVIPSPRRLDITEAEERDLHKQKPLEELQAALHEKAAKKGGGNSASRTPQAPHPADVEDDRQGAELTDDDIPFDGR